MGLVFVINANELLLHLRDIATVNNSTDGFLLPFSLLVFRVGPLMDAVHTDQTQRQPFEQRK